jgi:uncharacterized protein
MFVGHARWRLLLAICVATISRTLYSGAGCLWSERWRSRRVGGRSRYWAAAGTGFGAAELFESPHSFEIGGKQILLIHDLSDINQRSIDRHEVVVHGFTHVPEMKTRGDVLLVNPGEGGGWLHGAPSGAILDLDTKEVEFIKLTGPEWQF